MIRVKDCKSRLGTVTIFKKQQSDSLVYDLGGCWQSEADRNGVSLASYIHAIYGLVLQTGSKKILMIGCGGGTLGTMLNRAGCDVTVVDVDPVSFELARQYFDFPSTITCHVADGSAFLKSNSQKYDAIILDAFQGDQIPGHLKSAAFFRLVRSRLAPGGSVFSNVHVLQEDDIAPDLVADQMLYVWRQVRVLDSPGWNNRNAIAMAGEVSQLERPSLLVPPLKSSAEIAAELETMRFRLWKSSR
jgi:spermidine synthase